MKRVLKERNIQNRRSWFLTAKTIALALLPAVTPKHRRSAHLQRVVTGAEEYLKVLPEVLRQHGSDFTPLLDSKKQLRLFFEGCKASAAPAILFRLKRQGFSRCSARATSEGLYIHALR